MYLIELFIVTQKLDLIEVFLEPIVRLKRGIGVMTMEEFSGQPTTFVSEYLTRSVPLIPNSPSEAELANLNYKQKEEKRRFRNTMIFIALWICIWIL